MTVDYDLTSGISDAKRQYNNENWTTATRTRNNMSCTGTDGPRDTAYHCQHDANESGCSVGQTCEVELS